MRYLLSTRYNGSYMSSATKLLGKSFWFFCFIFILTLVPLLLGLYRFPKFLGDEGIYVSQAWWLVHFGKLGPYTYWYDHFPLGWLQIGLWQLITGGPFTFGLSLYSGRLFMALIGALSGVFLYRLGFILTKSRFFSLLVLVFFAFSPL